MFNKTLIFFLFFAVYGANSRTIKNSKFSNGFDPEDFKLKMDALKIKLSMMFGEHGKTVVEFQNGKKFYEINHERLQCDGTIKDNGECTGKIGPIDFNVKENFCYVQSKALFNDYECLAAGKSLSIITQNGKTVCTSDNGRSKVLIIPVAEYKKMCGKVGDDPTYYYYTDSKDPESIKIPNSNKYVTCRNNQPNICKFTSKDL